MDFFKGLFSSKKKSDKKGPDFTGVYSNEYFNKRYTEDSIYGNESFLEGCLKMVLSYFMDNKIEQKIAEPINHPENLDQVVNDGLGFYKYCRAFELRDPEIAMFLAYAFSDFLIKVYDFKLYADNEPEFPLRKMTLKYDKDQLVMSLYPLEYAVKVLRAESSFQDLYVRISEQMGSLPDVNEILRKFLDTDSASDSEA